MTQRPPRLATLPSYRLLWACVVTALHGQQLYPPIGYSGLVFLRPTTASNFTLLSTTQSLCCYGPPRLATLHSYRLLRACVFTALHGYQLYPLVGFLHGCSRLGYTRPVTAGLHTESSTNGYLRLPLCFYIFLAVSRIRQPWHGYGPVRIPTIVFRHLLKMYIIFYFHL